MSLNTLNIRNLPPQQRALITLWFGFFGLGALTGALGPALSDLATRTDSTLEAVGAIFTTLAIGTLASQVVAGTLSDRIGMRRLLALGLVLVFVGTITYTNSNSLALLLALSLITGAGFGTVDVTGQVFISRIFLHQRLRALNSLHLWFGIGAVVGPAVASFTLSTSGYALPALWLGAGVMLLMAPLILRLKVETLPLDEDTQNSSGTEATVGALLRSPLLWTLGIMLLLYVGLETGVSAWTTDYFERSTELNAEAGALVTSGYWLTFTLGRVMATLIGGRIRPRHLLMAMLTLSITGGLLMILGIGSAPLSIIGTLILGFAFGPIYPTMIAFTTNTFKRTPGTATGIVSAMGSIGILTLVWAQGIVLERLGIQANAIYIAVLCAAMFAAYGLARWFSGRRDAALASQQTAAPH